MLLQPDEVARVLKLPVRPVNVFGEPPVEPANGSDEMGILYSTSRGVTPSFGTRTSTYSDGDTYLYMHIFEGDVAILLGRDAYRIARKILVKIGYSNDPTRRCDELNAGFPPASRTRWKQLLTSSRFRSAVAAKAAEDELKAKLNEKCESVGGEFFIGYRDELEFAFVSAAAPASFTISA